MAQVDVEYKHTVRISCDNECGAGYVVDYADSVVKRPHEWIRFRLLVKHRTWVDREYEVCSSECMMNLVDSIV